MIQARGRWSALLLAAVLSPVLAVAQGGSAQGVAAQGSQTQGAVPAGKNKVKIPGSCRKIVRACRKAGFIPGDWKKGDGLWRDCVDPVVQGAASVSGASKALPSVPSDVVAACKAQYPKFGEGKVGSK